MIYLFFKVLIYDGNFDLICNHVGVKKMIDAMENWSGKDKYYTTPQNVWNVRHFRKENIFHFMSGSPHIPSVLIDVEY